MYRGLRVSAVIVAAGKGRRMGGGINKQFMEIDGIPVIARTLMAFDCVEALDGIVLVVEESKMNYFAENIIKKYDMGKDIRLVAGGEERQQSVLNGLNAIKGICDIVIIHDGARPFVTGEMIERSMEEAYINGAAACAVKVKDTIKVSDSNGFIRCNPERDNLYAVQTPQTFKYDVIYDAHVQALREDFKGTDDTVLVSRTGVKVKLIEGSYENIKITTPEDIFMAEAVLKYRRETANKVL